MTLLELLRQELPKRGGWRQDVKTMTQDKWKDIWGYNCYQPWLKNSGSWVSKSELDLVINSKVKVSELAIDWQTAIITREQYEAALAAKNDGWIEWGGGECPVPGDTEVLVKCKSEGAWDYRCKQRADEVSWTHDDSMLDIIAYRLHHPQEAEQPEESEEDLNECIGQAPVTEWNGEGLPPVGMEIEYKFAKANYRTDFSRGKVLAYGMRNVFMEHWASKNEFIQPLDKIEFRPLRTEAEQGVDEMVRLSGISVGAAKILHDMGYRKG